MTRPGGVFEPSHDFSLVNQDIRVNRKKSFRVRFPNIWESYKLPRITNPEIYDRWLDSQMIFWQMQLNFAVWCATSGCGISKEHLKHRDPVIRSIFRFHAYYQIRKILSEMRCPLPFENSWNPLNNGIDASAYERICNEFGVNPKTNWRQKFDLSNGIGSYFFRKKFYKYEFVTSKKWSELTNGGNYRQDMNWRVRFDADAFGGVDKQIDKIEYIEQLFDYDPGSDFSIRKGDQLGAIGSFVVDSWKEFTTAGISRINNSIRTYVWAILGAQAQTRSSIMGSGKAFDAQKQFLANVEDAINSEVSIPDSIDRYQRTLQFARSKVDFVIGRGLYMIPSDMEIEVGVVNGYNNLIQIASEDMLVGYNPEINEGTIHRRNEELLQNDDFDVSTTAKPPTTPETQPIVQNVSDDPLSQDEKKLSLILGAGVLGLVIAYFR